MSSRRLAFVDLETTGGNPARDRITEIGVVRMIDDDVVDEWSSLVDPQCPIPAEIQALTGITMAMVRDAPTFDTVADAVAERLAGWTFVAWDEPAPIAPADADVAAPGPKRVG